MKLLLITTIAAVVLVGCGEKQQSVPAPEAKPAEPVAEVPAQPSPPPVDAKPDQPVAEAAKPEPTTAKGTDYSGKYTLSIAKSDTELNFELKPDGSLLGKSSMGVGDDLIGSWKVEGEFLICEGTTENSSQIILFKFNKTTKKLISVSADGKESPIEDEIPEGEDGLYLKKN